MYQYDYRSYLNTIIELLRNIWGNVEQYFPSLVQHSEKIFFLVEVILVVILVDRLLNLGRRR